MGSQRSYLEDQIDDRDDADDEYWLIRDAVDAVDVYIDCMRTSSSQCVQSLVSTSRLILTHQDSSKPEIIMASVIAVTVVTAVIVTVVEIVIKADT